MSMHIIIVTIAIPHLIILVSHTVYLFTINSGYQGHAPGRTIAFKGRRRKFVCTQRSLHHLQMPSTKLDPTMAYQQFNLLNAVALVLYVDWMAAEFVPSVRSFVLYVVPQIQGNHLAIGTL